jgi:hypothetical protein
MYYLLAELQYIYTYGKSKSGHLCHPFILLGAFFLVFGGFPPPPRPRATLAFLALGLLRESFGLEKDTHEDVRGGGGEEEEDAWMEAPDSLSWSMYSSVSLSCSRLLERYFGAGTATGTREGGEEEEW